MGLRKTLFIAFLTATLLALATACGGGDGASELEQYFLRVEELAQDWDDTRNEVDIESREDFDDANSDEERTEVLIAFVRDERRLLSEFLSELADIDPPAASATEHTDALTAGRAVLMMYDDALAQYDASGSFEDVTAALESQPFTDATLEFGSVCVDIQVIAAVYDVAVDLRCPGA